MWNVPALDKPAGEPLFSPATLSLQTAFGDPTSHNLPHYFATSRITDLTLNDYFHMDTDFQKHRMDTDFQEQTAWRLFLQSVGPQLQSLRLATNDMTKLIPAFASFTNLPHFSLLCDEADLQAALQLVPLKLGRFSYRNCYFAL